MTTLFDDLFDLAQQGGERWHSLKVGFFDCLTFFDAFAQYVA